MAHPGGGMPGGGMPGGAPPGGAPGLGGMPGGGAPGGAAGRCWYICGAAETSRPPLGIICAAPGPPTPRTGPASPCGACVGGAMAIPRPAALPTPGPPSAPATGFRRSSCGGGPSTDIEMTVSPRTSTNPSVRFSSRSSFLPFGVILRNSSQSLRMRFMNLSKAMNLPTNMRPSWMVTRMR